MVIVAVTELSEPSLTLKVKLSEPLKSGAGVYVCDAPVPLSVPCAGPLTMVYVRVLLFALTLCSVNVFATSSVTLTDWSSTPGGFAPLMPASMLFSTASATFSKKS
jgi:hypothetical protein